LTAPAEARQLLAESYADYPLADYWRVIVSAGFGTR